MGNNNYDELKRMYARVWRTWDNASVLSYVFLPDGTGIRIGFKDYQMPILVNHALIGEDEEVEVILRAHTWNGSCTELLVTFGENEILVQSSAFGDDLVILIPPQKHPLRPTTVMISGRFSGIMKAASVECRKILGKQRRELRSQFKQQSSIKR